MTKQETEVLMNYLTAAYPHVAKNMTVDEKRAQLTIWYGAFKDVDINVMYTVVNKHINLRPYFPVISEIREGIRAMTHTDPLALYDELVARAAQSLLTTSELVRRGEGGQADTYRTTSMKNEAFAALPEEVKKYIGSADKLVSWARYSINDEAEKKKFLKDIREIQATTDAKLMIGGH